MVVSSYTISLDVTTVEGRTAGKHHRDRAFIGAASPMLQAKVDWSTAQTDLRGVFQWDKLVDGTWSSLGTGTDESLRSGEMAQVQIAPALENGGVYRFRVRTENPTQAGAKSTVQRSHWTSWGQFEVDSEGPATAPKVSSLVYGSDPEQAYGEVGLAANFTIDAGGPTDIVGYRWGWSEGMDQDAPTTGGAAVTLSLTPPPPDPNRPTSGGLATLYAQSYDRAGSTSPIAVYTFNIGSASSPVGNWRLDESPDSTIAIDGSGTGNDAQINGATPGTPALVLDGPGQTAPTAFTFDGDDSLETSGSVVDSSRSFSVSAWARSTDVAGTRSVVAQDSAGNNSGFVLRQRNGKWAFGVPGGDAATSTSAVRQGVWTHLAGVYDAASGMQRLYVNGTLAGSAKATSNTSSLDGPFTIGRGKVDGQAADFWTGDIANVQVWKRTLLADYEIPLQTVKIASRWNLAGGLTDVTAYTRDLVASGNPQWTEDPWQASDSAARFDGSTSMRTDGPALRTDQSLTVAGWMRMDSAESTTAVSQGDFRIGIEMDDTTAHWTVAQGESVARAELPATVATWTYVAATFDAATNQLRLYLDGKAAGSAEVKNASLMSGSFVLGGQSESGGFVGGLHAIRAYQGVLADSKIAELAQL